jgi:hypothetical protein
MKVVTLNESNFRDPVATLRQIADRIESGEYGAVGCVGVVVLGDTMEVFGMGQDSEAPSVALLLHAGFMRLSRQLDEHGQTE